MKRSTTKEDQSIDHSDFYYAAQTCHMQAARLQALATDYLRRESDSGRVIVGCKERSALKRASMDLTRALAELGRART